MTNRELAKSATQDAHYSAIGVKEAAVDLRVRVGADCSAAGRVCCWIHLRVYALGKIDLVGGMETFLR